MFCWNLFFFFFPCVISELRRPIAAKFCTLLGAAFSFIIPVQNFRGTSPQKFLWAKNMQTFARFWSTLKSGGEYLRKGWRYSKSVSYSFDSDSCRVRRNKSGEVWSSNLGDLDVELYPRKAHFFGSTAPLNLGGQKTFKNRCDLRQLLSLSANVSGTDEQSYKRSCWPTLSRQCAFGVCQCI